MSLTPEGSADSRKNFSRFRIVAFSALLLWQCSRLTDPALLGVTDFVEYWCAGRLNLSGGNPYSPDEMFPLQRAVGWDKDEPMMMQNPPWTLAMILPFAALNFPTGQVVWLVFHLALVFTAIELAWRFYGGAVQSRLLYWLIGLSFFPAIIVVRMGQIVPIMVVGLMGFLYFEKRGKDWLAGVMLAFVSIKPHLVYLVWPVMLAWIVVHRRWKILAGAVVATMVALAIPSCWNPSLSRQYINALFHRPPTNLVVYPTPTLGTVFMMIAGENQKWVRFIATAAGVIWLIIYCATRRENWNWGSQLPILILISVLTAFYTWPFDMVLFLIPLMQTTVMLAHSPARRLARFALGLHLLINGIALGQAIAENHSFWFLWMAPALTIAYFAIRRATRQEGNSSPVVND